MEWTAEGWQAAGRVGCHSAAGTRDGLLGLVDKRGQAGLGLPTCVRRGRRRGDSRIAITPAQRT